MLCHYLYLYLSTIQKLIKVLNVLDVFGLNAQLKSGFSCAFGNGLDSFIPADG